MKILVRFNKNIAIPRQVKSFKLFDLGIVSTTIDDLLDSTTIEIDDQTLPILKINNSSFIEYYLINDLGLTPGYSYPYYTDDFMKEVTIGDLVLINNGQMGEENIQSDWNQINILADDFIKNKPELFSGDYNDLINTPALVTNHSELNLDDGTNPHGTTKYDVDLGNADNTSDLLKPISNATQSALNSKLDKVTTNDVEKVYIKNADGTQGMKPVSDILSGEINLPAYTSARNDGANPNNKVLNVDASGNLKLYTMPVMPPPYLEELIPDSYMPSTTGNFIIKGSFFTPTTTVVVEGQTLNYLTFVSDNEMLANITTGSLEGFFDVTIDNGISVVFTDALLIVSGDVIKPSLLDWDTLGDLDFSTDGEAKIVTLNNEVSANVKHAVFKTLSTEDYRIQWKWAVSPLEDGSGVIPDYTGVRQYVALRRVSDDAIIYSMSMNNFPGSPLHMRFTVDGVLATAYNSDVATETSNVFSFRKTGSNWYLYINNVLFNSPVYFEPTHMYFEVRNRVFDVVDIKLVTLI